MEPDQFPDKKDFFDPTLKDKNKKYQYSKITALFITFIIIIFLFLFIVAVNFTYESILKLISPGYKYMPTEKTIAVRPVTRTGYPNNICENLKKYENKTNLNIAGKEFAKDEIDKVIINLLQTQTLDLPESQGGKILSYSIDYRNGKIAYILGIDLSNNYGSAYMNRIIYILDIASKKVIQVYEAPDVFDESNDRLTGIESIAFSHDGSLLAYTTTTGIYLYNINTKETSTLFETKQREPMHMGIYSYYYPIFSPDNRYLLYSVGYYEGFSEGVFDIQNKKNLDVSFGGYIMGTDAIGWYKDKLIVHEYGEMNTGNYLESSKVYIVDPQKPDEKELIWESDEGVNGSLLLAGDYLYISYLTEEPSGINACNNVGMQYEVDTTFINLARLDLKTNKFTKILTMDSTESSGVDSPSYKFYMMGSYYLNGEDNLFIQVTHNGEEKIYLVQKDPPYALVELEK